MFHRGFHNRKALISDAKNLTGGTAVLHSAMSGHCRSSHQGDWMAVLAASGFSLFPPPRRAQAQRSLAHRVCQDGSSELHVPRFHYSWLLFGKEDLYALAAQR